MRLLCLDSWRGKNPEFLIGEDVFTPGTPGDALRYMSDPAKMAGA